MRAGRLAAIASYAVVVLLALLVAPATADPNHGHPGLRKTATGSDPFTAGRPYRGDFPDPAVLKVGRTYFAYGTTTDNLNLPVLSSTNLRTWRPVGDGLVAPARWAKVRAVVGGRRVGRNWAPAVARIGHGFTLAYASQVRGAGEKMCISLARSKHASGGFVDHTRHPTICPATEGAIDPQVLTAPNRTHWLLYKTEGIPGQRTPRLLARRLNRTGTGVQPGTRPFTLLGVDQPWEGSVIENPAMIRYDGRYYLFYSANDWASDSYATGYAICQGVTGPCTRPATTPLLATGGTLAGTGGAYPFRDAAGRLRLAYASWDLGHVGYPATAGCRHSAYGCNQRRMHIATLGVQPGGTLAVLARR